ncbi:2OG-Fe(II) oxygenase [Pseudoalteromonas spongiae]|uniref:2OG-Fe(II) oxygenase n=1 Tax=Pseudoalteromonas spongiae TaxID=298657 RepID=UPI00110BA6AA|nr:2OG-Fe(II) oxygenase [Pseudoalteromonas spongiae]TMO88621.1 hypothetical protein CWC15_01250 [Pseudoalteromonas spongiae]
MEFVTKPQTQYSPEQGLVIEAQQIDAEELYLLSTKKVAAIRITNYYPEDLCEKITSKIINENKAGRFAKAEHVQRIGMPHFDIVDTTSFNQYHEIALQNIKNLREIYTPYLSPIDKFRLEMDEAWPAGAKVESLYGKKCFVGLCRIIQGISGSTLEPHIDRLSRDSSDSYAAHSLESQLAANIYIATPDTGGEVEIWLKEPEIEAYEKELEKTKSYHVNREILGEPDAVIKPKVGDLLLFNSRCFHAVKESSGGIRSSIAAFVGYRGINHSLSLWS